MRKLLASIGFVAALLAGNAHAGYTLVPVTVPVAGATNVALSTIDAAGDYAGTYQAGGAIYGFANHGGSFQTLPPIPGIAAPPQPTSITSDGTIAGIYQPTGAGYGTGGFVFSHGAYITPIFGQYGLGGSFGLTESGHAYFWYSPDAGIYNLYIGTASKLQPFSPDLHQYFYIITGQNKYGHIAGPAGNDPFACFGLACRLLLPKRRIGSTSPVVINDADQVAGVTQGSDTESVFLYDHGHLSFYPLSGPVGGISDRGAIAGVASDYASGKVQIFVLLHGKATRFGSFSYSNYPTVVGITRNAAVGIVVQDAAGKSSYIAKP